MSLEVFLQRFDPSGGEVPKRPDVLHDLERVARDALSAAAQSDDVTIVPGDGSFTIELLGGTATVHSTYAQFPIQELDPLTLRMICDIAKAGDMVIITEGGRNPVILTDPAQHAHLPNGMIAKDAAFPICFVPEQLEYLLQDWYHKQTGYTKRAFADVQSGGEAYWIPGSRPAPPAEFAYVEALPQENATKQQRKVYRHKYTAPDGRTEPTGPGLVMAEFWRLETPEGQAFYAYAYGGDKEYWLGMIRDFAASEGREVGRIENFDTFVQDDGRRFALAACTCMKVTD